MRARGAMPLIFADEAIGTLSVYTGQPYNFSNEEVRILSALAELSAIAIEKARIADAREQQQEDGPDAPWITGR